MMWLLLLLAVTCNANWEVVNVPNAYNGVVDVLEQSPVDDSVFLAGAFSFPHSYASRQQLDLSSAPLPAPQPNGAVFGGDVDPVRGLLFLVGDFTSPTARFLALDVEANSYVVSGGGVDREVFAVSAVPGGDVFIGGRFTQSVSSSTALPGLARLRGGILSPVGGGANGTVYALQQVGGELLYVGGDFDGYLRVWSIRCQMWDAERSSVFSPDARVLSLATSPGGLLVGGRFAQGVRLIDLSVGNGAVSTPGAGLAGDVRAFAVLPPSGDIVASGSFGAPFTRQAYYTASSGQWSAFGNPNLVVTSSLMAADGFLYIGGAFTSVNGLATPRIARYRVFTPSGNASNDPKVPAMPLPQVVCPTPAPTPVPSASPSAAPTGPPGSPTAVPAPTAATTASNARALGASAMLLAVAALVSA